MTDRWTVDQYREYHKLEPILSKKTQEMNTDTTKQPNTPLRASNRPTRAKYGNIKTSVDGKVFDSKKEADYYIVLKQLLSLGEIKGFCVQPRFMLSPKVTYVADFIVFESDGSSKIIDVKGIKTDVYKLKKKLFEEKFKELKIIEV